MRLLPEERKTYIIRRIVSLCIVLAGVAVDLLTKRLAVLYLKGQPSFVLIPGALQLTYAENRGAAFSMLTDARWVFLVASTVMIVAIAAYILLKKDMGWLYVVPLSMILSGGIGNMIERVANGYVVDFIDFCLINFAIFNGADSFVTVGAFILIFVVLRETYLEERDKKEKSGKAS